MKYQITSSVMSIKSILKRYKEMMLIYKVPKYVHVICRLTASIICIKLNTLSCLQYIVSN